MVSLLAGSICIVAMGSIILLAEVIGRVAMPAVVKKLFVVIVISAVCILVSLIIANYLAWMMASIAVLGVSLIAIVVIRVILLT